MLLAVRIVLIWPEYGVIKCKTAGTACIWGFNTESSVVASQTVSHVSGRESNFDRVAMLAVEPSTMCTNTVVVFFYVVVL